MNYSWSWAVFVETAPGSNLTYFQTLLLGTEWTVLTAVCAFLIALAVGTAVGIIRTLPSKPLRLFGNAYVELFRNIPLLVQMFLWFFVFPEFLPESAGGWLKSTENGPFLTAVICIGLFTAARVAEQVKAGIWSVSRGQASASLALGLSLSKTYRHVILPQAFRIVIPPMTSEMINVVKNTSVAMTIGLLELTARTRAMQEFSFRVFEAFAAATAIYLLLNAVITIGMQLLERRYSLASKRQKRSVLFEVVGGARGNA